MDSARIASKLREQILRFSGELSRGLPKVVGRFVSEMIYGVQARQSVRLTEVSRALGETIPIKKTVERLSRQLRNAGLGAWLTGRLLQMAAERVRETTLLILDLSDVHKKNAKKLEHLATVWDGSEKKKDRGYWTLTVIAAETTSAQIVPLYGRLYSHRAPEFRSENVQLREAIRQVSEKTRKRGIWVMDRGGVVPGSGVEDENGRDAALAVRRDGRAVGSSRATTDPPAGGLGREVRLSSPDEASDGGLGLTKRYHLFKSLSTISAPTGEERSKNHEISDSEAIHKTGASKNRGEDRPTPVFNHLGQIRPGPSILSAFLGSCNQLLLFNL